MAHRLQTRTRRDVVALIGAAPIVAAVAVVAPLSNVEKLRARLAGALNFRVSWGPAAANMTAEERAGVILDALDAPLRRVQIGPPRTKKEPIDVRDLVRNL